jgi:integrase
MGKLSAFLNLYESENTKRNYQSGISVYLQHLYPDDDSPLDERATRYLEDTTRDHEADIISFIKSLNGRPPKTVSSYLSAIKMFLFENDIELSAQFLHRQKRRRAGSRARTLDRAPTPEELKRIITHITQIQGKAFFLLLASTGMRISEALSVELDDVNFEASHLRLRGEYTKSGKPRHIFFTEETGEYLQEWLRYRPQYLKQSVGRSRKFAKVPKSKLLFPFTVTTARLMWNNSIDKAQLNGRDKSTQRRRLHPHSLRKFFRTQLGPVIPTDIVEALMGHESYLQDVYKRYTLKQIKSHYMKGSDALTIFGNASMSHIADLNDVIVRLSKEMDDRKIQSDVLTRRVRTLEAENAEMGRFVQAVEQRLERLAARLEGLAAALDEVASTLAEREQAKTLRQT